MDTKASRLFLRSMSVYWLGFGLITTLAPQLMDLFQTAAGVAAKTRFSDHVWFHGGLDIVAFCVVLFGLSRESVSPALLRSVAVAAVMPAFAIFYSNATTPYWSPLFLAPGLGCLAFAAWGVVLAEKIERARKSPRRKADSE
jgi:hypothetical protein